MGPNHTQVSNTFIDEYMHRLSGAGIVVFLAITRKTVGWHKACDDISMSQLIALTGIQSEQTIRRAIEELKNKRLVRVTPHVGKESTFEVGYQAPPQNMSTTPSEVVGAPPQILTTQKKALKERIKKEEHPTFEVPIGSTQYHNLCKKLGQKKVDEAIEARIDWERINGHKPAEDYASAANKWLKKGEEFNPSPTSHYCQNVRSDDPRRPNHKFVCGLTLQGGKCPECDR